MVAAGARARRGAEARTALTSRNGLLALRRALAERCARPDEVLGRRRQRDPRRAAPAIAEHRRAAAALLARAPRLPRGARSTAGWFANFHAQVHSEARAQADLARAAARAGLGAARPGRPGRRHQRPRPGVPGFVRAGGHGVDHVFGQRLRAAGSDGAARPRAPVGPCAGHRRPGAAATARP